MSDSFGAAAEQEKSRRRMLACNQANRRDEIAKNGAVVNMFYAINWLHDWWYNHGFDEVSGNAQSSNYGRGEEEIDPITGEEVEVGALDPILAQGQDASGRNNANMATPGDGSSPVMQQ